MNWAPGALLKPSTLNLTDSDRRDGDGAPAAAASRRAPRNGEPLMSPQVRLVSTDWYSAPAARSPTAPAAPLPVPRSQMSMNAAGSKSPRSRVSPAAVAIRSSSPKICETSCCSGSRSTSFAAVPRSESATWQASTGSAGAAGEPSARKAEVTAQPCSFQFPLPSGLNQPFSWSGAVPEAGWA